MGQKSQNVRFKKISDKVQDYPVALRAIENEDLDAHILGYGSSRIVVEHPVKSGQVVKFAVGRVGFEQNKSEYDVYQYATKNDSDDILASAISADPEFRWITMKKVNCPEVERDEKFVGPDVYFVKDELEKSGVLVNELQTGTVSNGVAVAYDYGGCYV